MDPPSRRAKELGPGEQPSGQEVQSEHQATFESGVFHPRTSDPMSVMEQLVSKAMVLPPAELEKAQAEDFLCQTIRSWLVSGPPDKPVGKSDVQLRALRSCWKQSSFRELDGVLHFIDLQGDSSSSGLPGLRCVLPETLRPSFLRACHEDFGHPGVKRTLRVLRQRAWWPSMKADVIRELAQCPTCLFNKETVYRGGQHIPENGSHPWSCWQMDLVHMHETRSGKSKALVFYDRFGRDVEAYAVTDKCSTNDILNIIEKTDILNNIGNDALVERDIKVVGNIVNELRKKLH